MPSTDSVIKLHRCLSDSEIELAPSSSTSTLGEQRLESERLHSAQPFSDNTGPGRLLSQKHQDAMRSVHERIRMGKAKTTTQSAEALTNPHRKRNIKDRAHPENMLTNIVKSNMNRNNQIGGDPVTRMAESALSTFSAVGLTVGMLAITGGASLLNVFGAGLTATKTLQHAAKNKARNEDFKSDIAAIMTNILTNDDDSIDDQAIEALLVDDADSLYHLANLYDLSDKNAKHYNSLKLDALSHAGIGATSLVALAGVACKAAKHFMDNTPALSSPAFQKFQEVATEGIPFTVGGLLLATVTANRVRIDCTRLKEVNQSIASLEEIPRNGLNTKEKQFLQDCETFFKEYRSLLKAGIALTSAQTASLAFLSIQKFLPFAVAAFSAAPALPIALAATVALTGYARYAHIQPRLDDKQFIAQLQKWFDVRLPLSLESSAEHSAHFQKIMSTVQSSRKELLEDIAASDRTKINVFKGLKTIWPGLKEGLVTQQRKAVASSLYDKDIQTRDDLSIFLDKAKIVLDMILDCSNALGDILETQHDSAQSRIDHLQTVRDQEIALVQARFFSREEPLEVSLDQFQDHRENGADLEPLGIVQTPAIKEIFALKDMITSLAAREDIIDLISQVELLEQEIHDKKIVLNGELWDIEVGESSTTVETLPPDVQQTAMDLWDKIESVQTQFINLFHEGKNSVTQTDIQHLMQLAKESEQLDPKSMAQKSSEIEIKDGPLTARFQNSNSLRQTLFGPRLIDITYNTESTELRKDPERTNKSFFKALNHIEDSVSRQKTNLFHFFPGASASGESSAS